MTKQLGKELINTWEWLDAYCLTQRGICELACGQHAIIVVQIDRFNELRNSLGEERFKAFQSKFETLMKTYALDDTIVAKYNDSTYVVVLHYINGREEIADISQEIRESVEVARQEWGVDASVSVGAAECHHDPECGYKCAASLAMNALKIAHGTPEGYHIAPETTKRPAKVGTFTKVLGAVMSLQ